MDKLNRSSVDSPALPGVQMTRDDEYVLRPKRRSTEFVSEPRLLDSMSSLDSRVQKRVVNVITVTSVLFFTVCFLMIAFTLRYSEYVDEKSRQLVGFIVKLKAVSYCFGFEFGIDTGRLSWRRFWTRMKRWAGHMWQLGSLAVCWGSWRMFTFN